MVFLGQVSSGATSQAVVKYIKDKARLSDSDPVIVTQLSMKGNTKSFKIGIESKHSKELETEGFWPPYVSCKNFVFRRPGIQNANHNYRTNRNYGNRGNFFPRNQGNRWRQ